MTNDSLQEIRPPREGIVSISDGQDTDLIGAAQDYAVEDKHKHELEMLESRKQDRLQRKEYAGKIFWLVCAWLFALVGIIFSVGKQWIILSDSVLIALIAGESVNIIALMVIVANYLFPKSK